MTIMPKIFIVILSIILFAVVACMDEPELPLSSDAQVVVTFIRGGGLLAEQCGDKNYIRDAADYIIDGTVGKSESGWNAGKTSIVTFTEMSIWRYAKGESLGVKKLILLTPGGTVGEITQVAEGQPSFPQGKRVRIYFQKKGGVLSIVCGQNGVEEVVRPFTR
jgi:hypothetical protein